MTNLGLILLYIQLCIFFFVFLNTLIQEYKTGKHSLNLFIFKLLFDLMQSFENKRTFITESMIYNNSPATTQETDPAKNATFEVK